MSAKQKKVAHAVKKWSDSDIKKAFLEVDAGNSIRKTAEKYDMSEGTLRFRLRMKTKGKSLIGSGKSTILNQAAEEQLANVLEQSVILTSVLQENKLKILFKNTSATMNLKHPSKMIAQRKIGFEHSWLGTNYQ